MRGHKRGTQRDRLPSDNRMQAALGKHVQSRTLNLYRASTSCAKTSAKRCWMYNWQQAAAPRFKQGDQMCWDTRPTKAQLDRLGSPHLAASCYFEQKSHNSVQTTRNNLGIQDRSITLFSKASINAISPSAHILMRAQFLTPPRRRMCLHVLQPIKMNLSPRSR